MKARGLSIVLLLVLAVLCNSCGIYSFSGTNLSPDLKTVSIANINMGTAGGPANMTQTLTEKLKEYFQRNTSLKLIPVGGDLALEGTITGYDVITTPPTANDQAGFNRLNVVVQMRLSHSLDETKNFDQSFTYYMDFPQDQTLDQNEARMIPEILDQLVQQIFNKSAADW